MQPVIDAMQDAVQGAMQGAVQGAHAPMHAHMLSASAEGALGRALLSGGGEPGYVAAEDQCLLSNVTYEDRHINTDTMTWCTVGVRREGAGNECLPADVTSTMEIWETLDAQT
eukprot:363863-Chlamydomonas_euryale.AAC.6